MFIDYYKILELDINCGQEEIKRAYRKLALKFHPDKNNDLDAHSKFITINEAYEILKDTYSRSQYNIIYKSYNQKNSSDKSMVSTVEIIKKDFKKYQESASKVATKNSKMSFDEFKNGIIDTLHSAYGATIDFMAVVYALVFLGSGIYGIFVSIDAINTNGKGGLLSPWPQLVLASLMALAGMFYIYSLFKKKD